jgi:hypothetical protein
VPGCRLPHLWLRDGRSLYDALGPDYTLLRLDPTQDVRALTDAATARGLPLEVLDVDSDEAMVYDVGLVLARPDQHIAWRGDQLPDDVAGLVERLRGASAG